MAKVSAAPSREILEAALHGLELQKQKLEEQLAQVKAMLGRRVGRPPKSMPFTSDGITSEAPAKKRVLSPEARKRIAAAQKKRWAAFRKTQE